VTFAQFDLVFDHIEVPIARHRLALSGPIACEGAETNAVSVINFDGPERQMTCDFPWYPALHEMRSSIAPLSQAGFGTSDGPANFTLASDRTARRAEVIFFGWTTT